ncbi:MAG TPA: hypothetical protein VGF48_07055 [Thermoanaerobaculia bacterium]
MAIRFRFYGICTHLRKMGSDPHRVVLVNGNRDFSHPKLKDIPRHEAKLVVGNGNGNGGPETLRGVALRIRTSAPLDYSGWTGVLPRVDVPSLSDEVVKNENAGEAAAYVDIEGGAFSLCCLKKAMVTTVTLDAAQVTFERRDFGSSAWHAVDVEDDMTIEIINASAGTHTEDRRHFHLHYLVGGAAGVDQAKEPGKECKELPDCPRSGAGARGPISLGPGCSNSEYP